MVTMTKRVNVRTTVAVRNINPPIYGTCNNIIMTTGDILKCLCRRAQVEEILPDGSTIKLNMSNYYTDNGAGLSASTTVEKKKATIKEEVATPITEPEEKEEAPVEETAEQPAITEETSAEEVPAEETVAEPPVEESTTVEETAEHPAETVAEDTSVEEPTEEATDANEQKETVKKTTSGRKRKSSK